jgi:plastocyanin
MVTACVRSFANRSKDRLRALSEGLMRVARLFVIGAVVVTAACGNNYSSSPTSPSPSPSPSPAPTPGGPSSQVTIPTGAAVLGNQAFSPDQVMVAVGDTVTWMNTDTVSHTSTSDATGWDSGIVAPGAQFSRTFQAAGTFRYHCAIHPGMVGSVVVQ